MDHETLAGYNARARVFKALAHPSRLVIVDGLVEAEKCVCELTALVGSDMSTVSKHLSVLKSAGVVQDQRRGAQIWYRLRMECVAAFFGCVEAELQKQAREQLDSVGGVTVAPFNRGKNHMTVGQGRSCSASPEPVLSCSGDRRRKPARSSGAAQKGLAET